MAEPEPQGANPGETSVAGVVSSEPPSPEQNLAPEDEIHAWLRYIVAQNPAGKTALDDIGQAVFKGGVAEGYRQYLEKMKNESLVITPRTWADQPESQAYKEREAAFRNTMLKKLRRNSNDLYKGYGASPFEDKLPGESAPRGILARARPGT